MDLFSFIATVIFISLSGVLMPGPIFATAILEGKSNKHAGIFIAGGHAIVEIPLIIILFLIGKIELGNNLKSLIGISGGFFLIYFALSVLKEKEAKPVRGMFAGIVLSSLNPYFIMWWITVGFALVIKANSFGIVGIASLLFFHESCDFLWYEFLSFASNHGMKFKKAEKIAKITSFSILMFFGFYFVYDGIKVIM